jgi:hypothetical protein
MEVFPHFIIRISSGEFKSLDSLRLDRTHKYVSEINNFEVYLSSIIPDLCDKIYHAVPSAASKKDRDILIEAKRDIYNKRQISSVTVDTIYTYVNGDTLVKNYCKYLNIIEDKIKKLKKSFVQEEAKTEVSFKKLTNEENFKKGLLLSSHELFELAEKKYWVTPHKKNRTFYSIQQGFGKYISRIYAKTSPFSTFTHIGFGVLKEPNQDGKLIELNYGETEKNESKSIIELNNYILKHLINLMVEVKPYLYNYQVSVNSSIYFDQKNRLKYFTNRGNTEAIQSIENTNTLLPLYEFIQTQTNPKFVDLLKFAQRNSETSKLKIESFLRKLYEIGFLEFRIGNMHGVNREWVQYLRNWLLSIDISDDLKYEFLAFLSTLENLKNEYQNSSSQDRKKLQFQAYSAFKNFSKKLKYCSLKDSPTHQNLNIKKESFFSYQSSKRFSFRPNDIFYEDSIICNQYRVNKLHVLNTIKKIDRLLNLIAPFELQYRKKIVLTNYFINHFGKENEVSLLDFYEKYQRDTQEKKVNSDFRLSRMLFKKADCLNKKTINLELDEIEDLLKEFPEELRKQSQTSSHSVFIQFHKNKENSYKSILNGVYPGFGKMFSRFLEADGDATEKILSDNIHLMGECLWAEDKDSSYFNANIHPDIMPYEISIPGGHNNQDKERRIYLKNLVVKYSEADSCIILYDITKHKRVSVFDLSFQAQDGRSDLYQFLENFTYTQYFNLGILISEISIQAHRELKNQRGLKKYKIIRTPRIELENQVVLSRISWFIPKQILPQKQSCEDKPDYFLKLNRWFIENGLPKEFFAYAIYHREKRELDEDILNSLGADDYKPQYISLDIPYLVNIFAEICEKVPRTLKVTEMLPSEGGICEIDGTKKVSEFLFQWNSNNNL